MMAKTSLAEICENAKLARDMALTGDYDSATIYYEGLQGMIVRMINSASDPLRKGKWTMVCIILGLKLISLKCSYNFCHIFFLD